MFMMAALFMFTLTSQVEAYTLPIKIQKVVGKTFSHSGPNCFAAALYGSDIYDSFRGVSKNEFSEVLKASCVKVDVPEMGDIGVYSSGSFGFLHAFVYLNGVDAFEKPGVDYLGKTPMRIQKEASIDYVHTASAECRRYGDESCHNQKAYYRCGQVSFNTKFAKVLKEVNLLFNEALQSKLVPLSVQNDLQNLYLNLDFFAESDLEKAIFESVEKQMQFFRFETQNLMIF